MSTAKQTKSEPSISDCEKLIGSLEGEIQIKGNILSTEVKWNAKDTSV